MLMRLLVVFGVCLATTAQAGVLEQAVEGIKMPLAKKPTSRPMTVAFVPDYKRYYVADGGLGPLQDGNAIASSRSEIHTFDAKGQYLGSTQAGLDNRSIYFNPNKNQLESITYNVSSDAGFTPDTGGYALGLDNKGNLTGQKDEFFSFNPAFGYSGTMPTFDPVDNKYFAKQSRSNKVLVVQLDKRESVAEIALQLDAAGAAFDDISDGYVAYTGIPGEEIAALDIDHKSILVFDATGKFVGKSLLPASMKLRAHNHYTGLGYANGMFFVYHEPEGEFGTYYGFKVSDQAVSQ